MDTSSASRPACGSADAPPKLESTNSMIRPGHESYELIFKMLMGIRTACGKFSAEARELTPPDFNHRWEGDFAARGTTDTPAHQHSDFRFKDFAPLVFRQLRERYGISAQDYMLSLTSEYVLFEMFSNSKSGSFFFYSSDYRFVLKTCSKREAAFLMSALPRYHRHLMDNRYTLLCRLFGLHRVQSRGPVAKEVYFVVMGNVFPIDRPIHERYDLKGSTHDRFTTDAERRDPNVVLKDQDFVSSHRRLHVGTDAKAKLVEQALKAPPPSLSMPTLCPHRADRARRRAPRVARGDRLLVARRRPPIGRIGAPARDEPAVPRLVGRDSTRRKRRR